MVLQDWTLERKWTRTLQPWMYITDFPWLLGSLISQVEECCNSMGLLWKLASIVSFKFLVCGTRSVLSKRTLISIPLKQPIVAAAIQSQGCIWLFATPWTAAYQAPLSSTISSSLLKSMCVEFVMLSNHSILCCSLFLLPSTFCLSQHQSLF